MNLESLLLKALKQVRKDAGKGTSGICGEVFKWLKEYCMVNDNYAEGDNYEERRSVVEATMRELQAMMNKWPGGGRRLDDRYPVEGSGYKYTVALIEQKLWSNPRRIALLNWLIKELENEPRKTL